MIMPLILDARKAAKIPPQKYLINVEGAMIAGKMGCD
jgi:hypothetical protein